MTGIPELMLGLGIIGGITAVIVVVAMSLARREGRMAGVRTDTALHETLRRAS